MIKTLAKTGNSYAVVLDRKTLEQTGIDEKTQLEITTNGDTIVIAPVRDPKRQARLKKIVEDAHRRYGAAFRKLAE